LIIQGSFLHAKDSVFQSHKNLAAIEQGSLHITSDGKIKSLNEFLTSTNGESKEQIKDYRNALIVPGFIDLHTHFPQTYAAASSERELISWLNRHIFPAESQLRDRETGKKTARRFVSQLLASGTTTACVYGSQFLDANKELFNACQELGLDIISGMTLQDRFTPNELLLPFDQIQSDNEELYTYSKSKNRVQYSCIPRFAISCSHKLLKFCGEFANAHDLSIQTHINESEDEVRWVKELFPKHSTYCSVYDSYGLLNSRTLLAHSIHSRRKELKQIRKSGASVVHCPSSNLFLGSGCFPLKKHLDEGVTLGLGTDIGAGTTFSILQESGDAYKVQQLLGTTLSGGECLYLSTLAGAQALGREDIGNFESGNKADFVVLSWQNDPYLSERIDHCDSLEDIYMTLIFFSNSSHVRAVYKEGKAVYENESTAVPCF